MGIVLGSLRGHKFLAHDRSLALGIERDAPIVFVEREV